MHIHIWKHNVWGRGLCWNRDLVLNRFAFGDRHVFWDRGLLLVRVLFSALGSIPRGDGVRTSLNGDRSSSNRLQTTVGSQLSVSTTTVPPVLFSSVTLTVLPTVSQSPGQCTCGQ